MFKREPGRHALLFIFLTVLIDVTGLGIIIPVIPSLIEELTGLSVAESAVIGGRLIFIYALMQFICSPIIGGLSDRYGRRPLLLISLAGFSIDYFLMGFAPAVSWLFVGRALSGIFGATYSTAGAFIADVSPKEKRAANFGLIGAAFGVGFIIGPMIGGFLGAYLGPRAPFYAASALAFINLIYGYIVLPESLSLENRRPFDWKRANPLGSLFQMRLHTAVLGLLFAAFLFQVGHQSYPSVWSFYMIERFDWTNLEVGFSLGAVGVASAIVQGGLTRMIIPKLGEVRTLFVGLTLGVLAYLGFALSSHGWMIYAWIPIAGLAGLSGPALQGIMANRVPDNAQGELQGALSSLTSLSAILAPLLLTSIFARYSAPDAEPYLPGAAFLIGALVTAIGLLTAAWALMRPAQPAREGA
jgi:DHA1 family tetracycline resistance protein-like MFS transporter